MKATVIITKECIKLENESKSIDYIDSWVGSVLRAHNAFIDRVERTDSHITVYTK